MREVSYFTVAGNLQGVCRVDCARKVRYAVAPHAGAVILLFVASVARGAESPVNGLP
ncbi:hypothetical protein DSM101010T_03580 [Desulfovibrio subterraneus]|uniref:Uncharacterized protein n=1 Tax=Desulfovibrio subterraneus TaxID=2718620 RepID=A0A7J0BE47_9BACT|nr:hypothetical protein DSM101010T_03580 [Desulfovibrio subterraneus]